MLHISSQRQLGAVSSPVSHQPQPNVSVDARLMDLTSSIHPARPSRGILRGAESPFSEQEQKILQALAASDPVVSQITVFSLLGMQIEIALRKSLDKSHPSYRTFWPLWNKMDWFLSRTIPRADYIRLSRPTRKEDAILGTDTSCLADWKQWVQTVQQGFLTAETKKNKYQEQFKQYTGCFQTLFQDVEKRKYLFYAIGVVCGTLDVVNPLDAKFLQKYWDFARVHYESMLRGSSSSDSINESANESVQLSATRVVLSEETSHEQFLDLLTQIRKLLFLHGKELYRADETLSQTSIFPDHKMKLELTRALRRSFIQCLNCLEAVTIRFVKFRFPKEYASDVKTAQLLTRLENRLNEWCDILFEIKKPLSFQPESDDLSICVRPPYFSRTLIAKNLTTHCSAFFDEEIQTLSSEWLRNWFVINGSTLAIPNLLDQPLSFTQNKLAEPVERCRQLIPKLPLLRQNIFDFFMSILSELPPENQSISYLRNCMHDIPVRYYCYLFLMADGARLLNAPFAEDDPIHPDFSDIFFLKGLEEAIEAENSLCEGLVFDVPDETPQPLHQSEALGQLSSHEEASASPTPEIVEEAPVPAAQQIIEEAPQHAIEDSTTLNVDEFAPYRGRVSSSKMAEFLKANGFYRISQRGSHQKFQHPSGHSVILPAGKDTLSPGVARNIQEIVCNTFNKEKKS